MVSSAVPKEKAETEAEAEIVTKIMIDAEEL